MKYLEDIKALKGVGDKTAELFHKLSVYTVEDLLEFYPRNYQSFQPPVKLSEAKTEEIVTVELGIPVSFKWKKIRNMSIGSGQGSDGADSVSITYFNMPYLKGKLTAGSRYLFRGKVRREKGGYHMDQPVLYTYEEYQKKLGQLWPCYSLTKGLANSTVMKAVQKALTDYQAQEYLPEDMLEEYGLMSLQKAREQIHFPKDWDVLVEARKRLVFDEFFLFLISVRRMKELNEDADTDYPMIETAWTDRFIETLPYRLTKAQQRVWEEIRQDLTGGKSMNRLVQGDVGSGKTILAFLALLLTVTNGYQGALMAPTEILASQHFEQLCDMTKKYGLPFCPILLTGSANASAKREIYRRIESGEVNVVIGTHALIQEKVHYKNLGLVVTDEQHRFGVRQRETLNEKGGHSHAPEHSHALGHSHVLVMSATPIPRTLAIILYGDLHLSVVDELPADRLPVKNCVVGTSYRKKAYEFITKQVRGGRQAYIICPMVEAGEEDTEGLENVVDYGEKLRNTLPPDICVEILHGKMKAADKKRVMDAFAAGHIHVLVSTTVIEVGINVPNATVMMVENAERFGLAQLHQLRGRIGRGKEQSYCIFINGSGQEHANDRLSILNKSNDGFFIAQEDLKLRGPGDLFGIRQSGVMAFKIADIYQDGALLSKISGTVDEMLLKDKGLEHPEHAGIKRRLEENTGNFVDFRSI